MKGILSILISLMILACDKSSDSKIEDSIAACTGSGKHKAIVIRKGCEAYVFQLLNPTVEVQVDWTEIFTKKKYKNVVSVMNYCSDGTDGKALQSLKQGETITFDLISTNERCLINCFAFEDAPSKLYKASNIKSCGD